MATTHESPTRHRRAPRDRRAWGALRSSLPPAASDIVVQNLREDEVLSYPLVLLEGLVTGLATGQEGDLFLETRVDQQSSSTLWPVVTRSGRFKAFVLISAPGKVTVTLQIAGVCERVFRLEYAPPIATPFVVKFHYQKTLDNPGDDNPDATAAQKVRFSALVLQMAVAEMMHAVRLPRQTFALEFAADGLPEVTQLPSQPPSVQTQELLEVVQREIETSGPDAPCGMEFKHLVVLDRARSKSWTRNSDVALGLFGSDGLHTWPAHLGELSACCLNNEEVDQAATRAKPTTFGAKFTADLGELLQVLGRTFEISIPKNGLSRLLCIYETKPRSVLNRLRSIYETKSRLKLEAFHQATDNGWLKLNHDAIREVKTRGDNPWHDKAAQLLSDCAWIWSPDSVRILEPVGLGQDDGDQTTLEITPDYPTSDRGEDLGAIELTVGQHLDELITYTRTELSEMESDWTLRTEGGSQWFVLGEDEYFTRVDVRAECWVHGLQLHTNFRSSRWFGGTHGELQTLQAPDGWRVCSFYGTEGDSYVGRLGVRCVPLSSPSSSNPPLPKQIPQSANSAKFFGAVGKAFEHGPKTRFLAMPDAIGAVVVRCGMYVESPFRVLTPAEVTAGAGDPKTYRPNDNVFELLPGEQFVKIEVSSGHWLDAVRFTTTLRVSPWYGGGNGINATVLECPSGTHICGFHGTHGKNYVGALGVLYCADGG
ncbi:hypothetical protein BBJ28_00004144 [Nothophytophthora sp. Chile5]|nr:hypothetical protein BBJ28_00004144 [Nothophytophthora sp. Chile5]